MNHKIELIKIAGIVRDVAADIEDDKQSAVDLMVKARNLMWDVLRDCKLKDDMRTFCQRKFTRLDRGIDACSFVYTDGDKAMRSKLAHQLREEADEIKSRE